MKRAIERGIDNLEELEWVEREEREAEAARQAALLVSSSVPVGPSQSVGGVDWSEFELDPSLLLPLATDEIPAESSGRSS